MNIVVCVKAVPGSTEVKMDTKTHTIIRDGGEAVVTRSMPLRLRWLCASKTSTARRAKPAR